MEYVKLPRQDGETPVTLPQPQEGERYEQPTLPWDQTARPSLWSMKALKRLFSKK